MFKKKQQNILILLMFCLLLLIAVAPIVMLNYNTRKYTNAVNVNKLSNKLVINKKTVSGDNDVLKNLNDALKVNDEKSNIVIARVNSYFSEEKINELVNITENQLTILQNMNAIPQFSYSDTFNVRVSKTSYLDKEDVEFAVNIWHIEIEYPDTYLSVYMDTETNVIYDVGIISENTILCYKPLSENGYKGYLQNVSDNSADNFDNVNVNTNIDPYYVHLFVIDYNQYEKNIVYDKSYDTTFQIK